jgi:hypothetical protein
LEKEEEEELIEHFLELQIDESNVAPVHDQEMLKLRIRKYLMDKSNHPLKIERNNSTLQAFSSNCLATFLS